MINGSSSLFRLPPSLGLRVEFDKESAALTSLCSHVQRRVWVNFPVLLPACFLYLSSTYTVVQYYILSSSRKRLKTRLPYAEPVHLYMPITRTLLSTQQTYIGSANCPCPYT